MQKRRFPTFNSKQRMGVFMLLICIITLQLAYFFLNFSKETSKQSEYFLILQKEVDSLQAIANQPKKDTLYPFNPNFITDYKGYTLGMQPSEIDRLLAFRKQGKFVNSAKEFQEVTKVSDSLLAIISPSFKFPQWVTQPKHSSTYTSYDKTETIKMNFPKKDINQASKEDLMAIRGIGNAFSDRIINYRTRLQGFSDMSQLYEVYGLEKEVVERITEQFEIQTLPKIEKQNLNTINMYVLAKVPYVNYDEAKKIVALRSALGNFNNFNELAQIEGFTKEKIERIQLYLLIDN